MKMNPRIIYALLISVIVGCGFVIHDLLAVTYLLDVSIKPAQHMAKHHQGVYLVSYADGDEVFYKNQNALAFSALNRGIDHIYNYRKNHLASDFLKRNEAIFAQKTGAGLWIWKPYVILKTMKRVPENAVIIYMDTSSVICNDMDVFVKQLESGYDAIFFSDISEKAHDNIELYTPNKFIKHFQLSDVDLKKPALWAGFIIIKNNEKTRAFISKWLSYCEQPEFINPKIDKSKEHEKIQNVHYDQGLLNVLVHKSSLNFKLMPNSETPNYVVWHHRGPKDGGQYPTSASITLWAKNKEVTVSLRRKYEKIYSRIAYFLNH